MSQSPLLLEHDDPTGTAKLLGVPPDAEVKTQGDFDLERLMAVDRQARDNLFARWKKFAEYFPFLWLSARFMLMVARPLPAFPTALDRLRSYTPYVISVFLFCLSFERCYWQSNTMIVLGDIERSSGAASTPQGTSFMLLFVTLIIAGSVSPTITQIYCVFILNHSSSMHLLLKLASDAGIRSSGRYLKTWVRNAMPLVIGQAFSVCYAILLAYDLSYRERSVTPYFFWSTLIYTPIVATAYWALSLFALQLKILGTVLEDHIAGITAGRYATDEKLLDVHLDLKKLVEEIASDWRGLILWVVGVCSLCVASLAAYVYTAPDFNALNATNYYLFAVAVLSQVTIVVLILAMIHNVNVLSIDQAAEAVAQCRHYGAQERMALVKQFELTPAEFSLFGLVVNPRFVRTLVVSVIASALPVAVKLLVKSGRGN